MPQENIFFLEDYITYHLNIGVDHFYLYDNYGSEYVDPWLEKVGNNVTINGKNKRGQNINKLQRFTEEELYEKMNEIISKYKSYITYIKWQPLDENGKITYDQVNGVNHCLENFGKDNEWIAFLDLDEYLHSKHNIDIINFLNDNKKFVVIRLLQKLFVSRFRETDKNISIRQKNVIKIRRGIKRRVFDFGAKFIIQPKKDFRLAGCIHDFYAWANKSKIPPPDNLILNHYKLNGVELGRLLDYELIEKNFKIGNLYKNNEPLLLNPYRLSNNEIKVLQNYGLVKKNYKFK